MSTTTTTYLVASGKERLRFNDYQEAIQAYTELRFANQPVMLLEYSAVSGTALLLLDSEEE